MDFELSNQQIYPAGTTVGAFPRSNWSQSELPPSGAPKGEAIDEAIVDSAGVATLEGLEAGVSYIAHGEVGGEHRYVSFTAALPPSSGSGPGGVPLRLQGDWDAKANSPILVDGTGEEGDLYKVSVAGSRDLGSGSINFEVGDWVVYEEGIWKVLPPLTAGDVRGLVAVASEITLYGTHAERLAISTFHAGRMFRESDTGLIYRDTGAAWALWKGTGRVSKTADETRNNEGTEAELKADEHIKWPIEANEIFLVRVTLLVTGVSVNADLLAQLVGPSGCTINQSRAGVGSVAVGSSPGGALSSPVNGGAINGTFIYQFDAFIVNGSTAGSVALKWAQNVKTAENLKFLRGSSAQFERIA